LNIFDFDHDLTWAAFFMNADGLVYGRFGGRDAKGPDTRNSLPGLRFALEKALETHRARGQEKPALAAPVFVEKYPSARKVAKNGCIHCHQVKEIRCQEEKDAGTWKRDSVWVYPLPENVGITLDPDRGNLVRSVLADSPAAKAGLKAGDAVNKLNGRTVYSFADFQYALHHAPAEGSIDISWTSAGQAKSGTLKVAPGWRKTNLTWRPSLLDLLPSLTIFGYDLDAKDRQALGLTEKQLAFRQVSPVHSEAQAVGVRAGDIILSIDNLKMEMTADKFLGYVRQNYLVGDRVTFNVLRDGKRVDLTTKLR
jgi:predicted metalloprotease with PDZ domain